MNSPENPYIAPDYEPSKEGVELTRPKTQEDWLKDVQALEAERDKRAAQLRSEGIDPLLDPDFNFLLGRVSAAQEQLIAHVVHPWHEENN